MDIRLIIFVIPGCLEEANLESLRHTNLGTPGSRLRLAPE